MENTDVNIQNNEGFSALLCAAEQGYTETVKEILARDDTVVTHVDDHGVDAVSAAKNNGHTEVAEMLFSYV